MAALKLAATLRLLADELDKRHQLESWAEAMLSTRGGEDVKQDIDPGKVSLSFSYGSHMTGAGVVAEDVAALVRKDFPRLIDRALELRNERVRAMAADADQLGLGMLLP